MLTLRNADACYGAAQALHQVSLSAGPGDVLALAGRNGAGKSTALKVLAGHLALRSGTLEFDGKTLANPTPEMMSHLGVAYVPEDRQVFPSLSVRENLVISTVAHPRPRGGWTIDRVFELFPRLKERRRAFGQELSGGEQQMLAIGRALLCQPRLLLLDEPTEGLAPVVVAAVVEAIREIVAEKAGIIIVEQNFTVPEALATSFSVMDTGRIAWNGTKAEYMENRRDVMSLLSGLGSDAQPQLT
ncbi:MAG: ABC transporter ATP-binding protein [Pseudooceanicola sp.]|jgi:branched-chain amino acid transport system ATP-binding protein|nr:ABC transporter ATP-binding protein [Pseudooceanicola sp.]|tara:strand:+ start:940 stop:1671 length:732 start_codon:yes stop_codon:yes gene_type:complete